MSVNNLIQTGYEWLRAKKYVHQGLEHLRDSRFCEIANTYPLTKENKEAIDDFYMTNYGEKIPYLFHQYFAAHSGIFDCRYFPNHLLNAYLEYYMNFNRHYGFVYEDKNVIPYIAAAASVKMPQTVLSKCCGVIRDGNSRVVNNKQAEEILKSSGIVFCKSSTGTYGGNGCFVSDFGKIEVPIAKVLGELGSDFVIQEVIKSHDKISNIYPKAANTFRIITYRWRDKFYQLPVFMRVGQGGAVVDNGAAGGMFLGVHEDGSLTDKAVMPYNTCIMSHPDTGLVFRGYKIEHFQKVCDAAMRMHQMIPQIGMVYWDFTIDTEGEPVLIECNVFNGTVYAIQMTLGVPAFGDRTAEILQWIKKMKHTPYSKRGEYAFGY